MIEQRKLTVTLETVTPMFLAGADPQKPELRAPSFMGALRYWTRAALGGVLGDNNLEALKKAEEEVWGSTNGSGALTIAVSHPALSHRRMNPLPHKNTGTSFKGFDEQQKFQLTMTHVRGREQAWEMGIASLLFMLAHGGVGRRSRRGWGTLRIANANMEKSGLNKEMSNLILAPARMTAKQQIAPLNWHVYRTLVVNQAINSAQQLCQEMGIKCLSRQDYPAKFPIASLKEQEMVNVVVQELYQSSEDAIKDFGEREHKFGAGQAFGSANPRWASPLWVRVLPIKQPKTGYVLAMTILKSKSGIENYSRLEEFIGLWPFVEVKS